QGRQLATRGGPRYRKHGGGWNCDPSVRERHACCGGEDPVMRKTASGWGLLIYAVFYLAFLYVPGLFLPLFSFNNSVFIAFPLSGFTTQWYGQMFNDSSVQAALLNSLRVGATAAVVSTALGLPAAKALTRYRVPGAGAVLALSNLSLFIPEIVLGISLLILLNVIAVP